MISRLRVWAATPSGRCAVRYVIASAASVAIAQTTFLLTFGVFRLLDARMASIVASCLAIVPAYYLHRSWAWGRQGRSDFVREVAPFWLINLAGLAWSTWAADFAESHTAGMHGHAAQVAIVWGAWVGAFALLWSARFVVFNRVLFRPAPAQPAPAQPT